jgi:hypothetical protein
LQELWDGGRFYLDVNLKEEDQKQARLQRVTLLPDVFQTSFTRQVLEYIEIISTFMLFLLEYLAIL